MLRQMLVSLTALVVVAGLLVAEELRVRFKEYRDDKLVVIDEAKQEHSFKVTDDVKFVGATGKEIRGDKARKGLSKLKEGRRLTIHVETKGNDKVLTEIKLAERKKPD